MLGWNPGMNFDLPVSAKEPTYGTWRDSYEQGYRVRADRGTGPAQSVAAHGSVWPLLQGCGPEEPPPRDADLKCPVPRGSACGHHVRGSHVGDTG